jgi:hypothetical protein
MELLKIFDQVVDLVYEPCFRAASNGRSSPLSPSDACDHCSYDIIDIRHNPHTRNSGIDCRLSESFGIDHNNSFNGQPHNL